MERVTGIEPAWPAWKAGRTPYLVEIPVSDVPQVVEGLIAAVGLLEMTAAGLP